MDELLKAQRHIICARLGHSWRFRLPVEMRAPTREVHAVCATCEDDGWIQLPVDGWQRFVVDLEAGRIA